MVHVDGRRIREMRINQGFTKNHLSKLTGIAVSTLSRIENFGRTSGPTLKKIADVFDQKPTYFLIESNSIKRVELTTKKRGPRPIKRKPIKRGMP